MRRDSFRHLRRPGRVIATAGLAVLLGLTGACGQSDDAASGQSDSAVGGTATTEPVENEAAAPADDCGAAQAEIKASLTGMSAVTSVDVPTCVKAVVATSLGADEGDLAASLCQNAANEASTHGVASVSVVSADGAELATGTTPEDCKAV